MRSFMKIKPLQNGKISLSFIDIGKSCLIHEFLTSLICHLMLFAKIISRKNFQIYSTMNNGIGSIKSSSIDTFVSVEFDV